MILFIEEPQERAKTATLEGFFVKSNINFEMPSGWDAVGFQFVGTVCRRLDHHAEEHFHVYARIT